MSNVNNHSAITVFYNALYDHGAKVAQVSTVIRLQDGRLGFNPWQGLGIFLFPTVSRPAPEPTQIPIQWVPGTISPGGKWLGHEADHSLPPSAKVKNMYSYTSTRSYNFKCMVLS
jgi:hypothetical protein